MGGISSPSGRLGRAFFLLFFILPFSYYSQISKESTPVFILQGTVKLKGKPIDGVSLELSKAGKQIIKMVTRKNGLYSFQMDKSNSDKETEYILDIIKEGAITGILRINTYTSKVELNDVPYIFNLEINLILPLASDVIVKHDFGKIKWDPEQSVFNFDKHYISMVEKKTDSIKPLLAVVDKIMKEAEDANKTPDEQASQQADTLEIQQVRNKEGLTHLSALEEPEKMHGKNDSDVKEDAIVKEGAIITDKEELAVGNPQLAKTEPKMKNSTIKSEDSTIKLVVNPGGIPAKEEVATLRINSTEPSENSNLDTETSLLKKKMSNPAELKTKENANKLSKNKQQTTNNKLPHNPPIAPSLLERGLRGEATNSFDGKSIFSLNNEKNKLLQVKEKMERKKTANLAKKYETNNTLTSLLDVVEEYDAK